MNKYWPYRGAVPDGVIPQSSIIDLATDLTAATDAIEGVADSVEELSDQIDATVLFVRKANVETVNNSTSFQDDNELLLAVAADTTYIVDCMVIFQSSQTADIKFAWTLPSGAVLPWGVVGIATSSGSSAATGSVITVIEPGNSAVSIGGSAVNRPQYVLIRGLLRTDDAGTVQLRWAQATLDATDTQVLADSYLRFEAVA